MKKFGPFLVVSMLLLSAGACSAPEGGLGKQKVERLTRAYSEQAFPDDKIRSVTGLTDWKTCATSLVEYVEGSDPKERYFVTHLEGSDWETTFDRAWFVIDGDEIHSEKECLALVNK